MMGVIITRPGNGISLNAGQPEVLQSNHIDLVFDDIAQAKDFLRTVCGWEDDEVDSVDFVEVI